ncbi:hypothetical protein FOC4_g10002758, partial [Fusarium odoratissimum]
FLPRPLNAEAEKYCINGFVHLPALQDTYTKRINRQWRKKAMHESARRVVEACSPEYKPQSQNKRLGPWGSGSGIKTLTMDKWLEKYDEDRMDRLDKEIFDNDDDSRRVWEN